jgi:ABC-type sugar transport system substrate-binding protein
VQPGLLGPGRSPGSTSDTQKKEKPITRLRAAEPLADVPKKAPTSPSSPLHRTVAKKLGIQMHKLRIALLTLAVAGSLALSACSSSGSGSSGSGGNASAGTVGVASSYNASAAAKVVDAALKNPTLIGITTPLTKKPPTGEFIVIVGTPTPVALLKDTAMAAAAKALGWRVVRLVEGTTPEAPAQTMMQAILLKPDMILFSGTDVATLSAPLKLAATDHIPVLAETVTGSPICEAYAQVALSPISTSRQAM